MVVVAAPVVVVVVRLSRQALLLLPLYLAFSTLQVSISSLTLDACLYYLLVLGPVKVEEVTPVVTLRILFFSPNTSHSFLLKSP